MPKMSGRDSTACVICTYASDNFCSVKTVADYNVVSILDAVVHECSGWNWSFSLSEWIGRCDCDLTLMHTTFLPSGEEIALNTG